MQHFTFLEKIQDNFRLHGDHNAFFIKGAFYKYRDLAGKVADVQAALSGLSGSERNIGVVLNDDLETYASILALWFTGLTFVPVNPGFPAERNRNIREQVGMKTILYSSMKGMDETVFSGCKTIDTKNLTGSGRDLPVLSPPEPEADLYILFTSGSTGIPKGVRISRSNLDAFVRDFIAYPSYHFTRDDRFLQIYDLSFDASIHCYVVPLTIGASVYTVPQDEIKFLSAYKLMLNHQLTFVKMPPSTLSFLRPYLPAVSLPHLKYCLLGGEAFPSMLAREWEPCVPNALIQNVYGPTEATINCMIYDWNGEKGSRKEYNGTVSIGRAFGSNIAVVADKSHKHVKPFETGELMIGGKQVSPGYWRNEELDREAFTGMDYRGKMTRFYRTGDMVTIDEEGDIMFLNRRDEQLQVQGYRVEPGEIEQMARTCLNGMNVVAMGKESRGGGMKLYLFVEGDPIDQMPLMHYLENHLPRYMIPGKIFVLKEFPRLVSGKLDRRALYQKIPEE
ncbi:MAG: AMP-binding protein [Bacteroidales bacterium]|nr:AMP-binding protein [Bacteroidales bacterium]